MQNAGIARVSDFIKYCMKTYHISIPEVLLSEIAFDPQSLYGKAWVAFSDDGSRYVYIFNSSGELILSIDGDVLKGSWSLVPTNAIIINCNNSSKMFHLVYSDDYLMAFQQDGKQDKLFLIDDRQTSKLEANTTEELQHYFNSKVEAIKQEEALAAERKENEKKEAIELSKQAYEETSGTRDSITFLACLVFLLGGFIFIRYCIKEDLLPWWSVVIILIVALLYIRWIARECKRFFIATQVTLIKIKKNNSELYPRANKLRRRSFFIRFILYAVATVSYCITLTKIPDDNGIWYEIGCNIGSLLVCVLIAELGFFWSERLIKKMLQ